MARETVMTEKEVDPADEQNKAKVALTELFSEVKNGDTPTIVERIVTEIDKIVRLVRFIALFIFIGNLGRIPQFTRSAESTA